jgi:hypothetical protein
MIDLIISVTRSKDNFNKKEELRDDIKTDKFEFFIFEELYMTAIEKDNNNINKFKKDLISNVFLSCNYGNPFDISSNSNSKDNQDIHTENNSFDWTIIKILQVEFREFLCIAIGDKVGVHKNRIKEALTLENGLLRILENNINCKNRDINNIYIDGNTYFSYWVCVSLLAYEVSTIFNDNYIFKWYKLYL